MELVGRPHRSYARWFVAGVVAALGSIGILVPQALLSPATATVTCATGPDGGDYGYSAFMEDEGGPDFLNSKGTYSEMWVPLKNSTPCQRVSSVYVRWGANSFSEFGWVQGQNNCNGSTYNKPVAFHWVGYLNGTHNCTVYGSVLPTQGAYVAFKTLSYGLTYKNFMGSSQIGTAISAEAAYGASTSGSERGTSTDDCFARWTELKEYHPSNSWTYWDDAGFDTGDPSECVATVEDTHTAKDYLP